MSNLSKYCAVALSLPIMSFSTQIMANTEIVCSSSGKSGWLKQCPEGLDEAPSQATVKLELFGQERELKLTGPTTILRGNPKDVTITETDLTDIVNEVGQYQNAIQTEMVKLELSGENPELGTVTIRAGDGEGNLKKDGSLYSPGLIYETDKGVCSVFMVRFEVEVEKVVGLGLHGESRMEICAIDRLPPISTSAKPIIYIDPRDVPILGRGGDIVGWIRHHEHELIEPSAGCGPGPHWVDDCPRGIDESPSSAVITIAVPCKSLPCKGPRQTVRLDGPTRIRRGAGSPHSIETEIISMVLTSSSGVTLRAGVDEGISLPSMGKITERSDTETADSFFDIHFEVEVPGIGKLHNKKPHHMRSIITKVPPIRDLHFPASSTNTEMFDDSGNLVGYLLNSSHVLDHPTHPTQHLCGPGPHWVDHCPRGTDESPSTAVVTVDMSCDGKDLQKVRLKGPTVIKRDSPIAHSIKIEITSMNLVSSDGTVKLRAGVDEDVSPPSKGQITELVMDSTLAHSSFDVFFEVEMPGAGILHNEMPHRMTAIIRKVPPINDHHFPQSPNDTKLFDASGNLVACLSNSAHILVDDDDDKCEVCYQEGYQEGLAACEVTVSNNFDIHMPRVNVTNTSLKPYSPIWADFEFDPRFGVWSVSDWGELEQ